MAKFRSFREFPPGGYRYVQPETGVHFAEDFYDDLKAKVVAHREYKGLPVETVDDDIQEQMCTFLGPDWCKACEGEDYQPVVDKTTRLTTSMVISLNKAIGAFLAGGCKFVDGEEAARRASICRGCPFNKPASSCTCHAAYRTIEALIPKEKRQPDVSVCMACGCSLQAKVNLPMDVIAKSLEPGIVFPAWCWQREALVK